MKSIIAVILWIVFGVTLLISAIGMSYGDRSWVRLAIIAASLVGALVASSRTEENK